MHGRVDEKHVSRNLREREAGGGFCSSSVACTTGRRNSGGGGIRRKRRKRAQGTVLSSGTSVHRVGSPGFSSPLSKKRLNHRSSLPLHSLPFPLSLLYDLRVARGCKLFSYFLLFAGVTKS